MNLFNKILKPSGKSELVELELSGTIPEESSSVNLALILGITIPVAVIRTSYFIT